VRPRVDQIEEMQQDAEHIADGVNEVVLDQLLRRLRATKEREGHLGLLPPTCEWQILHRKLRKRRSYIEAFARRHHAFTRAEIIDFIHRNHSHTALALSACKIIDYEQRLRDVEDCGKCIICLADAAGVSMSKQRCVTHAAKETKRKARSVLADIVRAHTTDLGAAFTHLTNIQV
jgi:hypothetical protein